jgi:uncharacterized membrane protein
MKLSIQGDRMSDATTDQALHHGAPAHALERLVFFSDAVFAISITLLGVELHAPILKVGASDVDFLQSLANLTPNFVGFFVSFFVIGAFWGGHHRSFDCAQHWSPRLGLPNLCLLSSVAAMPFFTAFMSENVGHRVPTMVYCIWLTLVAIFNLWNNSIAVSPGIVKPGIEPARIATIKVRGWAVIMGAVTSTAIGYFQPWLAQVGLFSIVFWRLLLQRWWPPVAAG